MPKILSIQEFGYWQIYILYTSFVMFLNFGWTDGLYLKNGGIQYENLDKKELNSQFRCFLVVQTMLFLIIMLFFILTMHDSDKLTIFISVCICGVILNVRNMLLYILLASERIKEYSLIVRVDRIVYGVIIFLLIILKSNNYTLLIFSDLVGKTVSLIMLSVICRDIVFSRKERKLNITNIISNISSGSKIMFSALISMLIIGIVRMSIEYLWSIEVFAKVSLTLSLSNFFMIFINSISVIFFPILRRQKKENLVPVYEVMRILFNIILFAILFCYFPLKFIISLWLPKYVESLKYMIILLPTIIFEGKVSLLTNTFLKTLHQEKSILNSNILSFFISIILTALNIFVFKNLTLAIISILIVLIFRSVFSEFLLSKKLNIHIKLDIILDIIITLLFMVTVFISSEGISFCFYLMVYVIYIAINWKRIIQASLVLRSHFAKKEDK
ncbi:MAG: hypothetical protein VB122_04810 [Erysipelotrichales bacterium]|nr:hypothetical protein [Erysipelotrichales bacterium]